MTNVEDQEDLKIFLEELNENLSYLDTAIISLEKDPSDKDTLEEIFRVAHTIKGNAGFLDLKNLVELGHVMENVFQEFHKGALDVSREVIDTLLACKDTISSIGTALSNNENPDTIETQYLVDKVNSFVDGIEAKAKSQKNANAGAADQDSESHIEYIPDTTLVRIWISPNEPAAAARAFLIKRKLELFCDIVHFQPIEEYWETPEFSASDRELLFFVKTDKDADEIPDYINVDLIERIEVIPEKELRIRFGDTSKATQGKKKPPVREDLSTQDTVRIPVERLDLLLNLVGELVIANSGLLQVQENTRTSAVLGELDRQLRDRVKEIFRISGDIQELVMKSRLVPISQIFNRFKRFIRDYGGRSGKNIELVIFGEDTEIDKKIIDEMIKPMTHIVRNAADHGIETVEEREAKGKPGVGTLKLSAIQEGNYISVIVEDDGKGIDAEKIKAKAIANGILKKEEADALSKDDAINLIFHSGLSTKEVADDLSGRGIGMDIVKRSIEILNGTLDLQSEKGKGTRLKIKLPLTLAIINALVVSVGDEKFSVPMSSIVETQKVSKDNILLVEGSEMLRLRNSLVPLIRIEKIFGIERTQEPKTENIPVIIVEYNETFVGILVDQFFSRHEMVIKSLTEHYRPVEGISGASILGDGEIILILDVHGVIQLYRGINTIDKTARVVFKANKILGKNEDVPKKESGPVETKTPAQTNKKTAAPEAQDKVIAAGSASVNDKKLDSKPEEIKEPPVDEKLKKEISKAQGLIDEMVSATKAAGIPEATTADTDTAALSFLKEEQREDNLKKLRNIFDLENRGMLKEWMRQGNNRAIQGIQALTGSKNIRIDRSKGKHISIEKIQKLLQKIENGPDSIIDFALPINPMEGAVHFILTEKNAMKIVTLLMNQANLPAPEEIDYEPIMEVTNILGSSYTNSLTQITEVTVEPGVPDIIEGKENLVKTIKNITKSKPFDILYVENQFTWEQEDIAAELLILIPEIKI